MLKKLITINGGIIKFDNLNQPIITTIGYRMDVQYLKYKNEEYYISCIVNHEEFVRNIKYLHIEDILGLNLIIIRIINNDTLSKKLDILDLFEECGISTESFLKICKYFGYENFLEFEIGI